MACTWLLGSYKYQVSNEKEFKLMTNILIGFIYKKSVPYVTLKIQILPILSRTTQFFI